jgi:hypothetical protein
MAMIVTMYGIILMNCSGSKEITGASFSRNGMAWANPKMSAPVMSRSGCQLPRINAARAMKPSPCVCPS